jgi:hypothetical protein
MSKLPLSHIFFLTMFEQNTVSILKYVINWIICEKNFRIHTIFFYKAAPIHEQYIFSMTIMKTLMYQIWKI